MTTNDEIRILGCETLPKLFLHRVEASGPEVALRDKDLGIWRAVTWAEYGAAAREVGLGLRALGLERGDVCSIAGETCKEWLFADLGVLGAGGVSNGVYPTDSPRQVEYLIGDTDTRFYFAEDEEQLDKVLEVRERTPTLEKIIVFDPEGLHGFQDAAVMTLAELRELGAAHGLENPGEWRRCAEAARPEDTAILVYTSGTTGMPKGAMISHRNLLFALTPEAEIPLGAADRQLAFLPLAHIAGRLIYTFWPLRSATEVAFAEGPDTVAENLREVSPTAFFAVPRVWEKFYSAVTIQLGDATPLQRWAYRRALAFGRRASEYRLAGRAVPAGLRLALALADFLVLGNLKRALGLDKARWLLTGAAPISPDLLRWFWSLGLELYEAYGQTECTALATAHRPGSLRLGSPYLGSVGQAIPGTEIRRSPEGEILIRGPHVFQGYHGLEELTAETLRDGWLHTGDVGEIDADGFLRITDRLKDILITAGGKNITPSAIENELKFSPFISDTVVVGDGRKYLTCLVMIDQDNVTKYAQDRQIPFTDFASLCRTEEVRDLIGAEIEKVNKGFARVETIKHFRLIDQLLTAEDDELTPTMKLKRAFVHRKYAELIESMYKEASP